MCTKTKSARYTKIRYINTYGVSITRQLSLVACVLWNCIKYVCVYVHSKFYVHFVSVAVRSRLFLRLPQRSSSGQYRTDVSTKSLDQAHREGERSRRMRERSCRSFREKKMGGIKIRGMFRNVGNFCDFSKETSSMVYETFYRKTKLSAYEIGSHKFIFPSIASGQTRTAKCSFCRQLRHKK